MQRPRVRSLLLHLLCLHSFSLFPSRVFGSSLSSLFIVFLSSFLLFFLLNQANIISFLFFLARVLYVQIWLRIVSLIEKWPSNHKATAWSSPDQASSIPDKPSKLSFAYDFERSVLSEEDLKRIRMEFCIHSNCIIDFSSPSGRVTSNRLEKLCQKNITSRFQGSSSKLLGRTYVSLFSSTPMQVPRCRFTVAWDN